MSISRWNPYPLWDVAGIQNWLEEMGREGYALGEWNSFWSIGKVPFYQDPSAACARYRLEPLGRIRERRKEDWERRQGYAAQGWHYVTTIHRMYEVFRCDDPEVPDLYTDTQSLSWAMKRLGRWQWLMVLLWLVWAVLVLWDSLSYLVTDPYFLLSRLVLESDALIPAYVFLLLLVGFQLVPAICLTIRIHRLRRSLAMGIFPGPQRPTYPALRQLVLTCLLLAAVLVFGVVIFVSGNQADGVLERTDQWTFPHVLLSEIVPPEADCYTYDDQKPVPLDTFDHSSLAPEQYRVGQGGAVILPDGTRQGASFVLEYVRTISPAPAQVLALALAGVQRQNLEDYQRYVEREYPSAPPTKLQSETLSFPGLDGLYRLTWQRHDESTLRTFYAGWRGDQVFTLECSGAVQPESALALLVQRMGAAA